MKLFRSFLFFSLVFIVAFWVSQKLTETKPLQSSYSPQFLANQLRDDLQLNFRKAIEDAKQSVTLVVYTLTDPVILSVLRKKADEGLRVCVLTDVKTARGLKKRLGDRVKLIKRFGKGLMHKKILVIDGEKIWIGSANMTKDSLKMHGNLVVGFCDLRLAKTIEESLDGGQKSYFSSNVSGQKIEVIFLPEDTLGAKRLIQLIDSAKKSIKVAMFTWTRKDLAESVIRAKKRGVDVQIVLDQKQSKIDSGKVFQMLKQNGIFASLSQGSELLHHKFLYIDQNLLVTGSANWTNAAFKKNEDIYLILYDLNQEQKSKMERLWKVILLESF